MKYILLIAIFLSAGLVLADEEVILGCTSCNAINYNLSANTDNGSCVYDGGGIIEDVPAGFRQVKPGQEGCPIWFPFMGCVIPK